MRLVCGDANLNFDPINDYKPDGKNIYAYVKPVECGDNANAKYVQTSDCQCVKINDIVIKMIIDYYVTFDVDLIHHIAKDINRYLPDESSEYKLNDLNDLAIDNILDAFIIRAGGRGLMLRDTTHVNPYNVKCLIRYPFSCSNIASLLSEYVYLPSDLMITTKTFYNILYSVCTTLDFNDLCIFLINFYRNCGLDIDKENSYSYNDKVVYDSDDEMADEQETESEESDDSEEESSEAESSKESQEDISDEESEEDDDENDVSLGDVSEELSDLIPEPEVESSEDKTEKAEEEAEEVKPKGKRVPNLFGDEDDEEALIGPEIDKDAIKISTPKSEETDDKKDEKQSVPVSVKGKRINVEEITGKDPTYSAGYCEAFYENELKNADSEGFLTELISSRVNENAAPIDMLSEAVKKELSKDKPAQKLRKSIAALREETDNAVK